MITIDRLPLQSTLESGKLDEMVAIDYGHLYLYFFPVLKQRNPSEYLELVFVPKTGSPIRRVLLQDLRLPDPTSVRHHHVWGVVDRLYNRFADVAEDVERDGGQLIADGPYSILPKPDESLLAYEFAIHELPPGLGHRIRLRPEGLFRLFVTHPRENRRLALEQPVYAEEVVRLFQDRHRMPVTDRRLLDRVHVEFQLAAEAQPITHEIDEFLRQVEPEFVSENPPNESD